jgi:hypothetical protein
MLNMGYFASHEVYLEAFSAFVLSFAAEIYDTSEMSQIRRG